MKQPHRTAPFVYAAQIGFFAGIVWGMVKIVEHSLKLTSIVPGFLVDPFYVHSFLGSWAGYAIGLLSFVVFSVVAAWIYVAMLGKAKGPWPGVAFGAAWWALFYLVAGPMMGMVPTLYELDWNSIITDFCLFLLWGLFIGYSIAVEFTDERSREPDNSFA